MDLLVETPRVRQIPGEPLRRWFSSLELDLIVWITLTGRMVGFQLCYDKHRSERAITWRAGRGFDHAAIDSGESGGVLCKGAPLLVANGPFSPSRVLSAFSKSADRIPGAIRAFVIALLSVYPLSPRISPAEEFERLPQR